MTKKGYSLIRKKLLDRLEKSVQPNKVTIIYGARQVGKTTILEKFLEDSKYSYKILNAEFSLEAKLLTSDSIDKLKNFIGKSKILAIDEAQHLPEIDLVLKLLVDNISDLSVVVTGSSSLDLSNLINEPLTGRKNIINIFPIAQLELNDTEDYIQSQGNLHNRLVYGSYPEIITMDDNLDKRDRIYEIVNEGYLWKDILKLTNIKNPNKLSDILRLLAYQLGKSVSLTSIGQQVGLDQKTVESYIDLLQKSFIIFERKSYSNNPKKGIVKQKRYYFYDNGVRNALIDNFKAIDLRDGQDVGMLWENYIVSERLKKHSYNRDHLKSYFWRYEKQEVDLVEEYEGEQHAYEVKWGTKLAKVPSQWAKNYPESDFRVVNPDNYLEFIS